MDYIAVLDYEHLDNSIFLTAFARSLSKQNSRGIILHGDSEYTERLIQTGVMREEATIRAMKDLNHRLTALFADEGISTIALNGHQKSLVTLKQNSIHINTTQLQKLPDQPSILISALGISESSGQITPLPLPELAFEMQQSLQIDEVTIFSIDEASNIIRESLPKSISRKDLDEPFKEKYIPESFRGLKYPVRLSTTRSFANYPDKEHSTWIE